MAGQVHLWCGTGWGVRNFKEFFDTVLVPQCVWAVAQIEVAPSTHGIHIQYAVYFEEPKGLAWMKTHIHATDHFTRCNGTPADNQRYCSDPSKRLPGTVDEVGPWEHGVMPVHKNRWDLKNVAHAIMDWEYRSYEDFARQHPEMISRWGSGIRRLFADRDPPLRVKTTCIYLWGPNNLGITTGWERAGIGQDDCFKACFDARSRTPNFAGYSQEPFCIIKGIDRANMPRCWWKQFADEVPVRIAIKRGPPVYFNSRVILVTSDRPPPGVLTDDEGWTRRWQVRAVQTTRDVELVYREVADLCRRAIDSGTVATLVPDVDSVASASRPPMDSGSEVLSM